METADAFYAGLQQDLRDPDKRNVQRRAFAGMIWSKQYFHYQARNWIWILYKHYPFWPRMNRLALLSAVYIVKGLKAGQLRASFGGIVAGVRGTKWITHHKMKLRKDQVHDLSNLNRRWRIRNDGRVVAAKPQSMQLR